MDDTVIVGCTSLLTPPPSSFFSFPPCLFGSRSIASSVSIRGDVRGDIFFFLRLLEAGNLRMNFGPSISLAASGVFLEASGVFFEGSGVVSLLDPSLNDVRT